MVILRKLLHRAEPLEEAELQSAILDLSKACKNQIEAEKTRLRREVESRRRSVVQKEG